MRSFRIRPRDWFSAAAANPSVTVSRLLLAGFLTFNSALAIPIHTDTADKEILQQAVKLLNTQEPDSRGKAVEIIRSSPKKSWAIIDQMVDALERKYDNRISSALHLVLSKADSEQLVDYWNTEKRIDAPLLRAIGNRLATLKNTPKGQTPSIDRRRGLAVFTESLTTNRSRFKALTVLAPLSEVEIEPKLLDAILNCLDDETVHERVGSCGSSFDSVREATVLVLQQRVASHREQLEDLLNDKHAHRRECGVRILAAHTPSFHRNGDRVLAMIDDEDAAVRKTVVQQLPLLVGRVPDVVATLTTIEDPSISVLYSLAEIFPKCNLKNQNHIATRFVDLMTEEGHEEGYAHSVAYRLRKISPELEQSTLNTSLDRLLTSFDPDNPTSWQLALLTATGTRAERVLPALRKSLSATEESTKISVATAIYRVAKDADEVLPYYRAALESDDLPSHWAATRGVKELGAQAAELAPLLMSRLQTEYHYRYVIALRQIGPPAAEWLPQLEVMHEVADKNQKKHFIKTIRAIRGDTTGS